MPDCRAGCPLAVQTVSSLSTQSKTADCPSPGSPSPTIDDSTGYTASVVVCWYSSTPNFYMLLKVFDATRVRVRVRVKGSMQLPNKGMLMSIIN